MGKKIMGSGSGFLMGDPTGIGSMLGVDPMDMFKPKPPNMPEEIDEKVDEAAEAARKREKERLRKMQSANSTRFSGSVSQSMNARTVGGSVNTTLGGNY